jgi:SAM-dependent methyltransferase
MTDPFETPIFILNFNQLAHLKKQIAWLTTRGYKRLVIIDNNSTFQPLLDFYDSIKDSVEVIRLERNFGQKALWDAGILERLSIDGPFVYTDSDIVPDDVCPKDLVGHLLALLYRFPQLKKVGPALRIDNLPDTYKFKRDVLIWEGQFWTRPVARGMFMSPIDTTLAVYGPHTPYVTGPAIRTGWPYIARHEPWYANSSNRSEEEIFYAETAKNGNWNFATLPELLETSIRTMQVAQKTLLHLGGGHELMPGWINLDVQDSVGADIVFDLNNCAREKLPLANDSIDGFFMCHVFEHIENTLSMMEELHRVAKHGAKFIIRLPHGATDAAFEDPTHKRACFPNTFVYFAQPAYSRADYGYLGDWQIERVKLIVDPHLLQSEGETAVLERARTQRNVVLEMIVELSAVKPVRARELRLLRWAKPTVSGSILDEDSCF